MLKIEVFLLIISCIFLQTLELTSSTPSVYNQRTKTGVLETYVFKMVFCFLIILETILIIIAKALGFLTTGIATLWIFIPLLANVLIAYQAVWHGQNTILDKNCQYSWFCTACIFNALFVFVLLISEDRRSAKIESADWICWKLFVKLICSLHLLLLVYLFVFFTDGYTLEDYITFFMEVFLQAIFRNLFD